MKNGIDVQDHKLDIAIVGMAGRFPGAKNIREFWKNLVEGKESITDVTAEQLEADGIDPSTFNESGYVKRAPVIDDYDKFDPGFFGYSPREAAMMDPQHRLFLECAWEALESAGYNPEEYPDPIGIYGGAAMNTYLMFSGMISQFTEEYLPTLLGNDNSFLTTRASYKLNLKGPSVTVQTACSTSLVAVHMACQSLLIGESSMALAGGVSVRVPHHAGYMYQEGSIFSQDGYCRTFDAKSSGALFGSGAGMVVLKRYSDAVESGDHIYAVIKGSAINNDGSSKTDYTAPSVNSQAEVIVEALANAGVDAETISYVEAHGTGTYLGDPIEIRALTKAFRAYTEKKGYCAIGSVKSNIGHLDAAAGIVGLIKTALALEHKIIPPSLHFEEPNPEIDFENSPFYVNSKLSEWTSERSPLRAGITSLGMGGTNAHVILEEYRENSNEHRGSNKPQLLVLSARSEKALNEMTTNLKDLFKIKPNLNLENSAFTLQNGRKEFEYRRTFVSATVRETVQILEDANELKTYKIKAANSETIFMFPGQGSQYVDMAKDLYENEPVFRKTTDECAALFQEHLGQDIRNFIYPDNTSDKQEAALKLQDTRITQPVLFTIEYALAKLWMSWGIKPSAVIGHSIGEYAAALTAGVFSLEEGVVLVAARGKLMSELPSGSMLAVSLPVHEVEPLLNRKVDLAGINSATTCVVSGDTDSIQALERKLKERDVGCRILHTSHAFHSYMMDPITADFRKIAEKIDFQPSRIPVLSTVKGDWIVTDEMSNPGYWVDNIRKPVQFSGAISKLSDKSSAILLEVGPGQTLSTLSRQQLLKNSRYITVQSIRHPKQDVNDARFILENLGLMWANGASVNWEQLHEAGKCRRVSLPTYPFQQQRCWMDDHASHESALNSYPESRKNEKIEDWLYLPVWKQSSPISTDTSQVQSERWLIFDDQEETGRQLAEKCGCKEDQLVKVKPGAQFGKLSGRVFTINPEHFDDYQRLFAALKSEQKWPDRIIHLWSEINSTGKQFDTSFVNQQQKGFYSLLRMIQAIEKQDIENKLTIEVVTRELHSLTGTENAEIANATIPGICNVIPIEYPHINCHNIDVDFSHYEVSQVIKHLASEISNVNRSRFIAYRGHTRWEKMFQPYPELITQKDSKHLKKEGVYVLTGALGKVGYLFAQYLAETCKAKLVLIGRTRLPDASEWKSYVEKHRESDAKYHKVKKLVDLQARGTEVKYIAADVGNRKMLAKAFKEAEIYFGEINGIIHAAGDVSVKPMNELSAKDCEGYFSSKVFGTVYIGELAEARNPDFVVNISSISSFLGGYGFAAYAASNSYLDFYSRKMDREYDIRTVTINWDVIQSATTNNNRWTDQNLLMNQKQVKAIFDHILQSDFSGQILVSATGNLESRVEASARKISEIRRDIPEAADIDIEEAASGLEQLLIQIWQEYLGVDGISIHDDFFELGGSSLVAVQIFNRIKKDTGIKIPMAKIFDHSTVYQLVPFLKNQKSNEEREVIEI